MLINVGFHVRCESGVWEGGVLYQFQFAIYVHDIIDHMQNSGCGIPTGNACARCRTNPATAVGYRN